MQVSARFRWKNRTGILIFFRFWMDICSYYPFFCRIVFPLHQKRSLLCRKDLFFMKLVIKIYTRLTPVCLHLHGR